MPRIARVTVPSVPHHVTQRGNRRQKTFFNNKDFIAARYIELNPVKAGLVSKPELWEYSNAASHVYKKEDALLSRTSLLNEMIDDWKEFLNSTTSEQDAKMLQQHDRTGRPLGSDGFLTRVENSIGRLLKPKRPGRKPKKGKK